MEVTKASIKKTLLETLTTLENAGFRRSRGGVNWSRRRNKGGTETLFVDIIDYRPKFVLEPALSIRDDAVERVFHRTSGFDPRFQAATPTISFAFSRISPDLNLFRYEVVDALSLSKATANIISDFQTFGLPFLQKNNSIAALDRLLNANPSEDSPYYKMDYLRCAHGLILAAMVGRANYNELESAYRKSMESFAQGFYHDRFEALVSDLRSNAVRKAMVAE
jgi:hypothetical protein